jgi:hypothetical protein
MYPVMGTPLDTDLIALNVQLNTRIGMIMEDVSLAALDATPEGLDARVQGDCCRQWKYRGARKGDAGIAG